MQEGEVVTVGVKNGSTMVTGAAVVLHPFASLTEMV
jgi:hypothetical protein